MRIALALFALTFLPGIPLAAVLVRRLRDGLSLLALAGSFGILWSVWTMFLLASLRVPLRLPVVAATSALPLLIALVTPKGRGRLRAVLPHFWLPPASALVLTLTVVALAYPLVTVQQGLPTGDVQKAIFWAERIRATARLPDYREALAFNRDPGDFAIPGLHTLTAALIELSGDALRGPAWFSFSAGILLAGLGAALASLLAPHQSPIGAGQAPRRPSLLPILTFLLAATNTRFLRYLVTPGYHYQNLIGELFLFLAFLLLLHTVGGRGGQRALLLAGIAAVALPLIHQFSAFLGLFLLPTIFLVLLVRYRGETAALIRRLPPLVRRVGSIGLAVLLAGVLLAAVRGPLAEKLPHLFTRTPHLAPYVIPLSSIPALLGTTFTLLAVAGVILALVQLRRRELEWRWWLLLLWSLLLFGLSQGARTVIDIPSARTLFYLTTPWSLFGALLIATASERVRDLWPRGAPVLLPLALALALAPTAGVSLNRGIQTIDHSLQANATLTPATLELLTFLSSHPPTCPANSQMAPAARSTSAAGDAAEGPATRTVAEGPFPGPQGVSEASPLLADDRGIGADRRKREDPPRQDPPRECQDAILIDDWNRRRTTWAILSPWRLLTRVGADLAVIAREAEQSEQRRAQYQALLDFEKIYALGNSPIIAPLLKKHGIGLVVGAKGLSADVFSANPALAEVYEDQEVALFELKQQAVGNRQRDDELRAPETLANDIGDSEDVFAHLPLSVLAPQISEPIVTGELTFREVRSAVSSLGLNVGVYVPDLWDENGDRLVDAPVEMLLRVVGNGAAGRVTRGTTIFTTFAVPADDALHEIRAAIPAGTLPIDEQGLAFVTVRLDRGPLKLDLAAARPVPLER